MEVSGRDVDKGWAWVVLFGAFITRLIIGGLIWSITAYFVVFHEEFGESRSYTSVIGAVTLASFHGFGPMASYLMQRFGCRMTNILGGLLLCCNFLANSQANGVAFLIVSQSMLFGLGLCLVNNSSLVAITHYFDRYQYTATGVSLSGSGVGIFLFAFLVPYIMEVYNWRGALLILAGLSLQVCICGAVMFPIGASKKRLKSSRNTCSPIIKQLCTSPIYWCMNFSFLFLIANFTIVTVLYKDFAVSKGLQTHFSWALAAYGAGDIVGRAVAGFLANHKLVNVSLQTGFTHLITAVAVICNLGVYEGIGLGVCGFFLGAMVGAQVAVFCMIPAAVWGREVFVVVIGYVQTAAGFGAFIGPPIAGFLADLTKSYTWSFIFGAIVNTIAAILAFAIYFLDKKEKSKKSAVNDDLLNKL